MQLTNKLILGTVQFGLHYGINNSKGKPDFGEVCSILDAAIASGITTLDTAPAYGDAIQVIGKYHQIRKSRFAIISKFHASNASKNISKELGDSLEILQIPFIDVYLFHSYQDYLENPSALECLIQEKERGRIKKIGVSIYTNDQLKEIIKNKNVDLVQLPYNLLDNNSQRGDLIQQAKDIGLMIHTRSVFLQGLFFTDLENLPQKLSPLKTYLKQIRNIVEENEISLSALALQYVLTNSFIDGVLIGVDSTHQLQENISMSKYFIDSSVLDRISKIVVKESELLNPVNWN